MCGIAGWAGGDVPPTEREAVLHRMTATIRHRGPDGAGYYVPATIPPRPGVGLGMRRLSIIDVSGGDQPIHNETRTVWVVFNGEIYNYRELRRELEARGHTFYTRSDTEVIVHAYEEHGEACVRHLRGMFAFAVWDSTRERLLLATDRLGIKPVYYAPTPQGLIFGSELKCLRASGQLAEDVDDDALLQYFTLQYIPPPRTIFRAARKLPPAHLLIWTAAGASVVRPYWDVPDEVDHRRPVEETRRQLRHALRDAVRSHLVSDVPLGAFLSGGIDSSSVVALMSENGADPVRTFTIGFGDDAYDERRHARMVADRYHTEHHELVVEPETVELLPRLVAHFDEPFGDSSALPTYYASKLARQFVKVVLSGDGGDELFLGYTTFQGIELARHLSRLPRHLRAAAAAVPRLLPRFGRAAWADRVERWRRQAAASVLAPTPAYLSKITVVDWSTLGPLLSRDLGQRLGTRDPFAPVEASLRASASRRVDHVLQPFVYAGLKVSLPGDMLVKVDRMSMANSLEVRVPLLDHALVEFAAGVPIGQRFPRWRRKGLLKDTMRDALPAEILRQPKRGFSVPLARWFRDDLRTFAADVLLSREARDRGLLDAPAVEALLGRHGRGRQNVGEAIWSLLVFELWCRQGRN